jgi:glycosyltransferase involved in cell wall biosynthesis
LIVDPEDAAAVADGMVRLLEPKLQARCRDAARRVARELSWENESAILAGTYRRATSTK